ncbi:hypothetical protein EJB05_15311, partial [Eragrostis curvula]
MVGAAGAAQSLISNVGQLLAAEYQQLSGVGGEVAELRDDLAAINALLLMQSEAKDGVVDHFIKEIMKQVRELAYDSEDRIDLYRLRIKCRQGDGVFARMKHLLVTLFPRRGLAGDIRALRSRAIDISERHARYGVNREALGWSPASSAAPMLTASAPGQLLSRAKDDAGHRLVVGMKHQIDTLAERLKAPAEAEHQRKVFSIVGFGGVGKTTLAAEVCRLLEADFPYQAFVSVSQAFDPARDLKALLKRVLEQIVKPKEKGIVEEASLDGTDGFDEHQLAEKLDEGLQDKRYLIVIDDVWLIRAWEAIQSVLPENNCNSRIIVTTRIETVAKACSPVSAGKDLIHHMQPLNFEDSKRLFLSIVFGSTDAIYPVELEEVMGNIIKRCGGIPLAIVNVASVLAGFKSSGQIDKWDTICKSIGSQMESNPTLEGMRHIVTLSFNHLPHELKGCMIYFSNFPEDYAIRKDRLLCRWIAEGLVSEKRGLTMMEVAESYLDELLSRNMIEEDHTDLLGTSIRSYRVHDMLLEAMVSRSLVANFVSLQGGSYDGMSYDRIRHLSIHGSVNGSYSPLKRRAAAHRDAMEVNVQHVRSLSMFDPEGHTILDGLRKFTLLRVLDLEDCNGVTDKHVRYACQLYLLKFLSFKGTNISVVPPQVENLEHLQTLDVREILLENLPKTVTKLERLECLYLLGRRGNMEWILPQGLCKMKALRELGIACLGNDAEVAREVGELEQLQRLGLYIKTNRMDVLQQLALSLSKRHSLRTLTIKVDMRSDNKVMNFLHDLPTPPRLLRSLQIHGAIDGLPTWVGTLAYLNMFTIVSISLDVDQLFSVLHQLPNLKILYMGLKGCSNDKVAARTSQKFPVLSHFKILGAQPNIIQFEEGYMEILEQLVLGTGRNKSETSIIGLEHLTNLKKVTIEGFKDSPAMNHVMGQLKAWNDGLPKPLQVAVKYY